FQENGNRESGKVAAEDRTHAMRHVHFADRELLNRIGAGSNFHVPKPFEQSRGAVRWGRLRASPCERIPRKGQNAEQEKSKNNECLEGGAVDGESQQPAHSSSKLQPHWTLSLDRMRGNTLETI